MQIDYFANEGIQFLSRESSPSAAVQTPQTPLPYSTEDCLEPYYMASHPLSIPKHSSLRSPQAIPTRSIPSNYMAQQLPSGSSAPDLWNSAPSTNSDCDTFSYQGSPAPGHAWVTTGDSPGSSAPSPRGWSPSAHQEYSYAPNSWMPSGQKPLSSSFDITICMASHDNKHIQPELGDESTQYPAHQAPGKFDYDEDEEAKEWAKYHDSPGPKTDYSPYGQHPAEDQSALGVEGPVCYAKLIRQALLSTPRHAMQLKEIYQWFKDHTEKGNTDKEAENKGWTNSVRHNLSMNKAFVRKARPPVAEDAPAAQNRKIIWEWCLMDFALGDGLKSTTQYRPDKNKNQRPKTRCPTRSNPGRKGGMCAGRSRMASKRIAQQGLLTRESHGLAMVQFSHIYPDLEQRHYHSSQQLHTYSPNSSLYSGSAQGPTASYAYEMHQPAAYDPVHLNSMYQPMPLHSTASTLPEQSSSSVYWHGQVAPGPYQA